MHGLLSIFSLSIHLQRINLFGQFDSPPFKMYIFKLLFVAKLKRPKKWRVVLLQKHTQFQVYKSGIFADQPLCCSKGQAGAVGPRRSKQSVKLLKVLRSLFSLALCVLCFPFWVENGFRLRLKITPYLVLTLASFPPWVISKPKPYLNPINIQLVILHMRKILHSDTLWADEYYKIRQST